MIFNSFSRYEIDCIQLSRFRCIIRSLVKSPFIFGCSCISSPPVDLSGFWFLFSRSPSADDFLSVFFFFFPILFFSYPSSCTTMFSQSFSSVLSVSLIPSIRIFLFLSLFPGFYPRALSRVSSNGSLEMLYRENNSRELERDAPFLRSFPSVCHWQWRWINHLFTEFFCVPSFSFKHRHSRASRRLRRLDSYPLSSWTDCVVSSTHPIVVLRWRRGCRRLLSRLVLFYRNDNKEYTGARIDLLTTRLFFGHLYILTVSFLFSTGLLLFRQSCLLLHQLLFIHPSSIHHELTSTSPLFQQWTWTDCRPVAFTPGPSHWSPCPCWWRLQLLFSHRRTHHQVSWMFYLINFLHM